MDHHEIERTYQPATDQRVPDLGRLRGVAAVGEPTSIELVATYFDTPDLAMTRAGVSLRRRTGGPDQGWHLKVPAGDGRDEIRVALGRSQRTVPAALRRLVLGWTRHAALGVVAIVTTHRTTYALLDDEGAQLAEFADDHVTATREGATQPTRWREWELELSTGGPRLLTSADKRFAKLGVHPSDNPLKIARALEGALPPPLDLGKVGPGRPAGRVLHARLAAQVAELLVRDSEIRRGLPVGVHQARVTCRRLRGALATFHHLVDPAVTDPIRADLQWLQGALGEARDAHVVHTRLRAMVDDQDPVGPVHRRLEQTYRDRSRAAQTRMSEVLMSERYLALLDDLEGLAAAPPWTEDADRPANVQLRKRIRADWRRLTRRVQGLEATGDDPAARDDALHEVRKAAKRLRYALEAAEPVWGEQTQPLHRLAQAITQVLGERQDTVVARQDLLTIAETATADGENAFTYGRMHHREETLAAEHERQFEDLWRSVSPKELTAWLD